MKPWEEEWEVDEACVKDGDYSATDREGFRAVTAYACENDELAQARLRLVAVAPDMVRALLATAEVDEAQDGLPCWCWEGEHGSSPGCTKARAALKKAGVFE